MKKFGDVFENRRNLFLHAAACAAVAVPFMFVLISAAPIHSQSQTQNTSTIALEYEVASIRPSAPGAVGGFMTIPGRGPVSDSFTAKNFTLMMLIRAAYGIPLAASDSRVSGGPSWLNTERFDVDAKMDSSVADELKKLGPDQRMLAQQHMLQALLADRCKMTIRREARDLPIYTLVIAKNGPKLVEAKPDEITSTGSGGGGGGMESITGHASSIANLVRWLSVSLDRPVLDNTGLAGKYDFKLEWTPDDSQSDSPAPSLFTAIQEQLGLKLDPGKGPVEIIMIDHVERPSGN